MVETTNDEVEELIEKKPEVILAILCTHGFEKIMEEIKDLKEQVESLRKEMLRPGWRSPPERRHKASP